MMLSSRLVPVALRRVSAAACCVTRLLLIPAGLLVLSRLGQGSSYWLPIIGLCPLGAGMGLAMTPATSAVTDSLPPALQGVGSATNDLARELGGALGIAVLGSVLSSTYQSSLRLPATDPAGIAAHARTSLGAAASLGGPVLQQSRTAFVDGKHAVLLDAAAATVVKAAAMLLLLRRRGATSVSISRRS